MTARSFTERAKCASVKCICFTVKYLPFAAKSEIKMNILLHIEEGSENIIIKALKEIFHHGFVDSLKVLPFLFLTYLLMEFIEHKASDKSRLLMERAGTFGPLFGGLAGALPQCGFSVSGANFYTGRVITMGTLVAIFLSTSDEMLPILISKNIAPYKMLIILLYKVAVAVLVGFMLDLILRLFGKKKEEINIDGICDEDNCHCERGIFHSALHHTVTIGVFVLLITLAMNTAIFFIGEENLSKILYDKPVISHIIAALFGLIPNCAASILLTNMCAAGYITTGTMLSGLFSGAGVGIAVLVKMNKKPKENLIIIGTTVLSGIVFGLLADVMGFMPTL